MYRYIIIINIIILIIISNIYINVNVLTIKDIQVALFVDNQVLIILVLFYVTKVTILFLDTMYFNKAWANY